MLIAQALLEDLTLVTHDATIQKYEIPIMMV
jgi:PIN domain nuclease of toxin-antitoxin system